jgi:anti-anti-sigma factor
VRREQAHETSLQALGRLVLGHGADWDTWAPVFHTFATGPIRLDLAGVTELDAAGLGVLARLARRARYRGRACSLVAAPPRVRRLLALTRLDGPLGAGSRIVDSARSRSTYW